MGGQPGRGVGHDRHHQDLRGHPHTKNDPNVHLLAQIPPPAQGGVTPPPGTPFDFTVGLLQDGSLELKWKCSNPSGTVGTIYEVLRKAGPSTGAFVFLGATGVKTFTDDSLPLARRRAATRGSSPCTLV